MPVSLPEPRCLTPDYGAMRACAFPVSDTASANDVRRTQDVLDAGSDGKSGEVAQFAAEKGIQLEFATPRRPPKHRQRRAVQRSLGEVLPLLDV